MSTRAIANLPAAAATPAASETHAGTRPGVADAIRRVRRAAEDALLLIALVAAIPFVILALGLPIALFARILLWVASLP